MRGIPNLYLSYLAKLNTINKYRMSILKTAFTYEFEEMTPLHLSKSVGVEINVEFKYTVNSVISVESIL